jgi:tight adherence protein B
VAHGWSGCFRDDGSAMTPSLMTMTAVSLGGLAALLAVGRAPRRDANRRLETAREGPERKRLRIWWPIGLASSVSSLLALLLVAGARVVVLALTGLILTGSGLALVWRHRRAGTALQARVEVATACSVLAAELRVGRIPAEALGSAAVDCPVLAGSAATLVLGGDPVPLWLSRAGHPGCRGLADLARAWQVSHQTGAPLAPALEQVAAALAADAALRRLVAGEVSAPRATAKVMAVLPFFGIAIGYGIGGRPLDFLLAGPVGWGCLLGGVALAAIGVGWIERLARSAADQG